MQSLQFLNDTVPCGFIKYTCEKQPRITYINDRMLKMLRFPNRQEDPDSYMNILGSNVFRLFAPLDRPKLADFLEKVAESTKPMIGEISVLRGDGSKGRFYGWITKVRNPDGTEEFQRIITPARSASATVTSRPSATSTTRSLNVTLPNRRSPMFTAIRRAPTAKSRVSP